MHRGVVRVAVAVEFVAILGGNVSPSSAAVPVSGELSGEPFQAMGIDPFNFVAPTVCGMNISTKDAFDHMMQKYAFHKAPDGAWWIFTEPAGTTKVSALLPAAKMATIVFVPAQREALPASIIQSMTAKALSVAFVPPDKLSFGFAEIGKIEGCKTSSEIVIALKDGSWLETDQTVTWGAQP